MRNNKEDILLTSPTAHAAYIRSRLDEAMFHVTQVLSSYDVGGLIGRDQFRFMADCFTNGTLLLSISEHILPENRAVKDELTPMIREMRELITSRGDRIGDIHKLYDKLLPTLAGSLCIKVRNATQSLGRGADQAAAREGRSPNEQDSFSSEKSYSPKRLTWAHESME